MTYITKIFAAFVFALAISLMGSVSAQAQQIDVNWKGDRNPTLHQINMAPGDAEEHEISVHNDTPDTMDVYINLDRTSDAEFDDEFSKQLKFYVIDKSNEKYLVGGSGDKMNLKEAVEDGDTFMERLDADEKNTYIIKVRFDKDAGNEFQSRSTKFDITMQISGELTAAGGGTLGAAPFRPGQVVGGNNAPEGEVLGESDVAGNTEVDANGDGVADNATVLGLSDNLKQCVPYFSWWVWVLGIIGFTILFNGARIMRLPRARNIFRIVAIVGAMLGWFFYDNCRDYWWALIIAAIIALVSLFVTGQDAQTGEET